MSRLSVRSSDAASSWMLAVSACIHGFCILALIAFSGSFHKPKTPPKETINHVVLIPAAPGPPKLHKVQPETAPAVEPPSHEQVQLIEQTKPAETNHSAVVTKAVKAPTESISLKKRKKRMKTVKAPKPPEKKPDKKIAKKPDKKDSEPAKKKEDPNDFLSKRIAALRKEVEKKRSDAVAPKPKPEQSAQSGAGGIEPGTEVVDRELLEWYAAVRNRINETWSVFASYHHSDRVTVVGIKLADNGRLMDATLNQTSGDEVLDRSALRAVHQANPFPRVPAKVAEKIRQAGGIALEFTVKGMQ